MFADSRYADIEKKCRYADFADADINIGTPLDWGVNRFAFRADTIKNYFNFSLLKVWLDPG